MTILSLVEMSVVLLRYNHPFYKIDPFPPLLALKRMTNRLE